MYFINIIVNRQSPHHQGGSGSPGGHVVTGILRGSVDIHLTSRKVVTMVPPNTTRIVRTVGHQPRPDPSTRVGICDNTITERYPSFSRGAYAANPSDSRALRWFQRFHCRTWTGWYWRAQFPRVTTESLFSLVDRNPKTGAMSALWADIWRSQIAMRRVWLTIFDRDSSQVRHTSGIRHRRIAI